MARRAHISEAVRQSRGDDRPPPPAPVGLGLDVYEAASLALAHELQHQANMAAMREYEDHRLALEYARECSAAVSPRQAALPQGTLLQELQAMQAHQDRLFALECGRELHIDDPSFPHAQPRDLPAAFHIGDQDYDMDQDYAYDQAHEVYASPPPEPRARTPDHTLNDVDPDNMTYEQLLQLGEQVGDVKKERWREVSAAIITSLPTNRWTAPSRTDVSCVICQGGYAIGDISVTLPCAHVFHGECLSGWALDNNSCPICKLEIAKI